MNLQAIHDPRELLEPDAEATPYQFENFIKLSTMGDRRRSKRKLNILKLIDPDLRNILQEDESVYFVTDGTQVSSLEQLFIGWVVNHYNMMAFVFTTKRILLLHIESRKKKGVFLRSIEYTDMTLVKGSFLSGFKIKLRNASTLTFSRMPGADRKELISLLDGVLDTHARTDRQAQGMRNLCPNCLLDYGSNLVQECSNCQTKFKTPRNAAMLSLVMPGLGDLYLGSKALGILELMFMSLIWFSVFAAALPELLGGASVIAPLLTILFTWAFLHPLDAIKAHYIARKGLFPVKPPAVYGLVSSAGVIVSDLPQASKSAGWKWLLWIPGGAVIAFVFAMMVFGILAESGIIPDAEIVRGEELPATVFPQLVETGIIDADNPIIYFYGDAMLSYLESGTILAEKSIIIYFHDESNELLAYEMPFTDIVSVDLVEEGNALVDSIYMVAGATDDYWIQFTLPAEGDADERFIADLKQRCGLSTD